MSKIFREVFTPEEFEIYNLQGEKFIIKTQFVPTQKSRELEALAKSLQSGELGKNETSIDVIHKIMIVRCGGDAKFWGQFSIELLTEIANSFRDDSKKKSEIQLNSEE